MTRDHFNETNTRDYSYRSTVLDIRIVIICVASKTLYSLVDRSLLKGLKKSCLTFKLNNKTEIINYIVYMRKNINQLINYP